jgi:hypothetical protein
MSMPLAQALQGVDLQKGQIYRCEVKGLLVELRVLERDNGAEAPSIPESDIMLDAWVALPKPPPVAFGQSKLGKPKLPTVPEIPAEEGEET